MNFSFPFLDDEGATQSQAFIRVVSLKSFPQSCHQTLDPRPLLGSHLQDLLWLRVTVALILLIFILPLEVGSIPVKGLKFNQTQISIIKLQIIISLMFNQRC